MKEPRLKLAKLSVEFPLARRLFRRSTMLRAVDGVSFDLRSGEALGIVGESGCGKSTLIRAILQLVKSASGQVIWLGNALERVSANQLRPLRADLQIIFQDPLASLNPRMTIGQIVEEPLRVHRPELTAAERMRSVTEMLDRVGLSAAVLNRYPHEFSGGQCQRIGIARAMILRPKLLVCDEPVSALDVSIQAQIINLLMDLRHEHGMSILFVSHNLAVVRRLCDRVLVLYLGRMMELAPTSALYDAPAHPYTRMLLECVPVPDPAIQPQRLRTVRSGELPSPAAPPSGCVFRTRCVHAIDVCARQVPEWESLAEERFVACHRWRELNTAAVPFIRSVGTGEVEGVHGSLQTRNNDLTDCTGES